MPKTETKTRVYNIDLELSPERAKRLLDLVRDQDLNDGQKIGGIAMRLLHDQADGGLMLRPGELKRIHECTGIDPTCGEDLLEPLSEVTGMEQGKHIIKISIDPAWWEYYSEPATLQGRTTDQVLQEVFDYLMDNDPFQYFGCREMKIMRMTDKDKKTLVDVLGANFENGTELAKLIRQALTGPLDEDPATSNVGQEEA